MTTKRVTVTEREYDSEGRLVKETETVTEYETINRSYPSPWVTPMNPPYVSHYL